MARRSSLKPHWVSRIELNRRPRTSARKTRPDSRRRTGCAVRIRAPATTRLPTTTSNPAALGEVYNVAVGGRTSLNELYANLREILMQRDPTLNISPPVYEDFRPGDVRHSQADISKARRLLGYSPSHDLRRGLSEALPWYGTRATIAPANMPCGKLKNYGTS